MQSKRVKINWENNRTLIGEYFKLETNFKHILFGFLNDFSIQIILQVKRVYTFSRQTVFTIRTSLSHKREKCSRSSRKRITFLFIMF